MGVRLLLIVPATQENQRKRRKSMSPPLGLAMVAAVTPPDVELTLTDENATDIDLEGAVDLVGITVPTFTALRAYQIADAFRARGVKVVLGGIHVSFMPDEASQHADAVVIGEAEEIWPGVIADFRASRLQKIYRREQRSSLLTLPRPRRDLFDRKAYFFNNVIQTSRGCPHGCSFCSVTSYFGHAFRCRPVAEVLREIETLDRSEVVAFIDDNIIGNPAHAGELFRALVPLGIRWAGQASLAVARHDDLLELAAASGCLALLIGFETLSQANLAATHKRVNVVDQYEAVIRKVHSHGIAIHGFFIFGLDEDEEDVFARTVRFAQRARIESAMFAWPVPYPGTALCASLEQAGRITTRDWAQYESTPVFQPKRMSQEALKRGTDWAWREFYSLPSIWRRVGVVRRYAVPLWTINLSLRAAWRDDDRSGAFMSPGFSRV
jgi:radical SAM superfamily enzyme YgiQ (UPF0313 family)